MQGSGCENRGVLTPRTQCIGVGCLVHILDTIRIQLTYCPISSVPGETQLTKFAYSWFSSRSSANSLWIVKKGAERCQVCASCAFDPKGSAKAWFLISACATCANLAPFLWHLFERRDRGSGPHRQPRWPLRSGERPATRDRLCEFELCSPSAVLRSTIVPAPSASPDERRA